MTRADTFFIKRDKDPFDRRVSMIKFGIVVWSLDCESIRCWKARIVETSRRRGHYRFGENQVSVF